MPTSNPQNISPILETVMALKPESVLDVGVGTGKMGFLLREYLDLFVSGDGKTWPPPRRTRIDGIEAHGAYITDIHRDVYDELYIEDAHHVLSRMPDRAYDLVLMIDVLEHFSVADARAVLRDIKRIGSHILAVVPIGEREQASSYGNQYERHRMGPTRRLLRDLGFSGVQRRNGSYFASEPNLRLDRVRWRTEYRVRTLVHKLPSPVRRRVTAIGRSALRGQGPSS
jgi:hypothetical protein